MKKIFIRFASAAAILSLGVACTDLSGVEERIDTLETQMVAIALLDSKNNPVKIFVDEQTDLSQWIKGSITSYKTEVEVKGVAVGGYSWAVGIVDTTRDNEIGIRLAAASKYQTESGWVRVGTISVTAR